MRPRLLSPMSTRPDKEHHSDRASSAAATDSQIVMAEQITHDVVKEAQSMGGPSPVDDTASTTNTTAGNGEAPSGPTTLDSTSSDALPTTTKAKPADTAPADVAQPSETAGGDAAQVS